MKNFSLLIATLLLLCFAQPVAGAVGAATGGAAFAAAGGAAGGIGGFAAGSVGGMTGYAFAAPIQSIGNTAYFGDPPMTPAQFAQGMAISGLMGGSINGFTALANGRSFWTGTLPKVATTTAAVTPAVTTTNKPAQTNNNVTNQPQQTLQQENTFSVTTTKNLSNKLNNLSIEKQGLNFGPPRLEISGYHPRLASQTDLYHDFPTIFDKIIIQGGEFSLTNNGGYWYVAPGSINSVQGFYTIGINSQGIIYHRCFYEVLPIIY